MDDGSLHPKKRPRSPLKERIPPDPNIAVMSFPTLTLSTAKCEFLLRQLDTDSKDLEKLVRKMLGPDARLTAAFFQALERNFAAKNNDSEAEGQLSEQHKAVKMALINLAK